MINVWIIKCIHASKIDLKIWYADMLLGHHWFTPRIKKKIHNKLENTDYGRPMKPFFIEISNFWALADNLGVFSADLSAPILVLWVPCPCFPLFNNYTLLVLLTKTFIILSEMIMEYQIYALLFHILSFWACI